MKKLLLIGTILLTGIFNASAQEVDPSTPETNSMITISEQEPFQQLISYAIEVSSIALEDKKAVGKYNCGNIYSMEGYTALSAYPCQLIIHSDKGPLVVRYQDILPEIDAEIRKFLKENQMEETLYYNNGRFRFSLNEEDFEEKEEEQEPTN